MHDNTWPADEEPKERPVANTAGTQHPVKRPERERQALCLLQLQVRVVIDAIREERKDDPGQHAGGRAARQRAHQQRRSRTRHDEPGQKHEVVDDQRRNAGPMQRRRENARQQQRLRVRERPALGIEDVGVENAGRSAWQLMGNPRQDPRFEQRIPIVVHAIVQMEHLRVGHHGGEHREDHQHRGDELHDPRMSRSSESAPVLPGPRE